MLKKRIRDMTPKAVGQFLIRLGNYYARGSNTPTGPYSFPSQKASFRALKSLGWSPKTCIDVGAYHGTWAKSFQKIYPDSKVLMLEGQSEKEERLRDLAKASNGQLDYEIALLGAIEGKEVSFTEMGTGSSVFEEASHFNRTKKQIKLKTLDKLLERHSEFQNASALKLDTQGYELEVMKGAQGLLERVEVILTEVSLMEINKGAPLCTEIIGFLAERQFKLFDFCSQIRRKDGVLWQTDLLFVRDGCIPNLRAELTEENWA